MPAVNNASCQAPSKGSASSSDVSRQGLIGCAITRLSLVKNRRRSKARRPGTNKRSSECNTSSSECAPSDIIVRDNNRPNFYQCLIQSRSWGHLERHMRTERGLNQLHDEPLVLQNALKYHAPLTLIKSILNRKETCLYERDAAQRNVLHIAAMSWSSPEIVEYLLKQRPRTIATELDCDGRTPLHLLLASADEIQIQDDDKDNGEISSPAFVLRYRKMSTHRSPSQITIQVLVNAAPETLNLEDADHMSPIEYAILSNDSIQLQTIQKMRRRSEKQWKKSSRYKSASTTAAADVDGDDYDSSSSSSNDSSLCHEIPLGSRKKGGGGGGSHQQPLQSQRRVSRNATTA